MASAAGMRERGDLLDCTRQAQRVEAGAYALRRENTELAHHLRLACATMEAQRAREASLVQQLEAAQRLRERSPTHLPPPPSSADPRFYAPPRDERQHPSHPSSHRARLPDPTHTAGGVGLGLGPGGAEPSRRAAHPSSHRAEPSHPHPFSNPVRDPGAQSRENEALRRDVLAQGEVLRQLAAEAEELRQAVLALPSRDPSSAERPEREQPRDNPSPSGPRPARRSRRGLPQAQEQRPATLGQLRAARESILERIKALVGQRLPRGRRARAALEENLNTTYDALDTIDTLIAERQGPTRGRTREASPERERLEGKQGGCYACTHDLAMKWMTNPRERIAAQRQLGRRPH